MWVKVTVWSPPAGANKASFFLPTSLKVPVKFRETLSACVASVKGRFCVDPGNRAPFRLFGGCYWRPLPAGPGCLFCPPFSTERPSHYKSVGMKAITGQEFHRSRAWLPRRRRSNAATVGFVSKEATKGRKVALISTKRWRQTRSSAERCWGQTPALTWAPPPRSAPGWSPTHLLLEPKRWQSRGETPLKSRFCSQPDRFSHIREMMAGAELNGPITVAGSEPGAPNGLVKVGDWC